MIPSVPSSPLPSTANTLPGSNLPGSGLPRSSVNNSVLLEVLTQPNRLPTLQLGELLTAKVADQLVNNQLAVLIKNGLFTLSMPAGSNVQAGDILKLRVMSLSPGLTLALQDASKEGAPAKDTSVAVALSPASRYLTTLLTTGDAAKGKPLLLDAAQQAPAKVAETLQKGVSQSGLFYESHLKDFSNGLHSLEALQQEPQAKFASLRGNQDDALSNGNLASGNAAKPQAQLQELGGLVQRQLDGLESRNVQFQAMAWPGQPMQMQIEQERVESERQGNGQQEMPAWSTSLALSLPTLGGMAVRVRLVGQSVQVSFNADESSTGQLIENNAARLQLGMAAAGLTLASLVVKDHEPAAD